MDRNHDLVMTNDAALLHFVIVLLLLTGQTIPLEVRIIFSLLERLCIFFFLEYL